ncbi:SulP family inorganic anion transporter [Rhodococcus globerulus]|uniref:SulP family inorganic anion transporter n=1 Tax=Rhodococcus globerulus TaxID=33008 RepID=UPI000AC5AF37|nr:SulP family inorganic anion transporter [Rhodococcus globerulus]
MSAVLGRIRALLPRERMTRADVIAGLPGAIGSVPDGMASGVLAGVSPLHGLYASMAGRVFGGLSTSTRLMVVTTTSASALAAGSALTDIPDEDRSAALVMLTLVAGGVMIVAAVLRLGRYTRFVSHSVMTAFLLGVAANIAFGQIPALLGVDAEGGFALAKAVNVLTHPGEIDWRSAVVGVSALILMWALGQTRLRLYASLVALLVPTVLVVALGWDSVSRVSDIATIPTGFPIPGLPDLTVLSPALLSGALTVAVIVLVQGAGVAESAPNPDGSRSSANRDFTAQGVGNVAASLLRGMPVGGSVGQTALNRTAGARTRWAAIWSGLWLVVLLRGTGRASAHANPRSCPDCGSCRVPGSGQAVGHLEQRIYLPGRVRYNADGDAVAAGHSRGGNRGRALTDPAAEPGSHRPQGGSPAGGR